MVSPKDFCQETKWLYKLPEIAVRSDYFRYFYFLSITYSEAILNISTTSLFILYYFGFLKEGGHFFYHLLRKYKKYWYQLWKEIERNYWYEIELKQGEEKMKTGKKKLKFELWERKNKG